MAFGALSGFPDAFTVGSNIALPTYNSGWVLESGAGSMQILASTDEVSNASNFNKAYYSYQGSGSPNGGDQRITASVYCAAATRAMLTVRQQVGVDTCYAIYLYPVGGREYRLYKITAGVDTLLYTATFAAPTLNAFNTVSLEAVDSGSDVILKIGNGVTTETFTHLAVNSPLTTGRMGIGYNDASFANNTNRIDDLLLEAAVAPTGLRYLLGQDDPIRSLTGTGLTG